MPFKLTGYLRWFVFGGVISLAWLIVSIIIAIRLTGGDALFSFVITGLLDGWAVIPWSEFMAWISKAYYGRDYVAVPPWFGYSFPLWQFIFGGLIAIFIRAFVILLSLPLRR